MKTRLIATIAAVAVPGCFSGCSVTTITEPDGTVIERKEPNPDVLRFAGAAIRAYSPRPIAPTK